MEPRDKGMRQRQVTFFACNCGDLEASKRDGREDTRGRGPLSRRPTASHSVSVHSTQQRQLQIRAAGRKARSTSRPPSFSYPHCGGTAYLRHSEKEQ